MMTLTVIIFFCFLCACKAGFCKQTVEQPTHSRMTIARLSFQQHTVYCEGSIPFHVHNVYESAFKKSGRYACCQQKQALAGECIVEYHKADEP
jgi:hypothetical protein